MMTEIPCGCDKCRAVTQPTTGQPEAVPGRVALVLIWAAVVVIYAILVTAEWVRDGFSMLRRRGGCLLRGEWREVVRMPMRWRRDMVQPRREL